MKVTRNFLYKFFSRNPIKKSIVHLYGLFFFIPVFIISQISIYVLNSTLKKWELDRVNSSLVQAESSVNDTLSTIKDFSDSIYVNKPLQDVLTTQFSSTLEAYLAYTNLDFLTDLLHSYREISSFRIYSENQTLLDNSFILKTTSYITSEMWYQNAVKSKGQVFWVSKIDSVTKKEHLALIRSIWNFKDDSLVGVLVINVSPEYIIRILKNQFYESAISYGNKISFYSHENVSLEDQNTLKNALQEYKSSDNTSLNWIKNVVWREEKSFIMARKFKPNTKSISDFTILYIIPRKDLNRGIVRVIVPISIVILIILLMVYVTFRLFSNYINDRVVSVRNGIQEVVDNNFSIPSSIGGNDEFEQIYRSLFIMSEKLSNLVNQVYKQKLEREQTVARQNEIRYKMLATQINPHFLFNTLETIRMKSLASGDKDVSTMLKLLASLLRYNLGISGKTVPLFKELEAIQNYLNIQRYRFGSRISYDIITMCDVQKISILPLLIQPLVENSFSHGLESTVTGGFIYIFISEEEQKNGPRLVNISVKDNGCGIPEEKLAELNLALQNDSTEDYEGSIGLMNVNSRIRLYYGSSYGVKIISEEGQGTEVKLSFPLIDTEQVRNSRI